MFAMIFDNVRSLTENIVSNHEWVFSGIGCMVLGFFIQKISARKKDKNVTIRQTGYDNSTNIGIQNNYYGNDENGKHTD